MLKAQLEGYYLMFYDIFGILKF